MCMVAFSEESTSAWDGSYSFASKEESKRYHPGKNGDPVSYVFSSSIHAIQEHARNIVELKVSVFGMFC